MVFKRKVVSEEVPAVTPVVTPVAQPVVERNVTIDRDGMGGGTAVALILAGICVIALVWYLAWYRPQTEVVTSPAAPSVIEHNTEMRTQPMPVPTPSTPVIVNPPTPSSSSTTVVTPPANNTTVVNPPATDTDTTTSTTTDETGASTTTTTTTDNNGG